MSKEPAIGVIGGSGLYDIEGLSRIEHLRLSTPFGEPSEQFVVGHLGDTKVAFLPRHGRQHRLLPHEINFRANVHGMKQLGVEWLLSISAEEEIRPGDLVVVDQFFDRTKNRASTFFGGGIAGHVAFADPICPELAEVVADAAESAGARTHRGGTYLVIEGPMFSTRAESRIYRNWGVDVIGMTNLPEAKLAREAEICYATLALATDYDCWHETEADVSVNAVLEVLRRNVALAKTVVKRVAARLPLARRCPCPSAAAQAVMTAPEAISPEARARLALLLDKYWKPA